MGLIFPNNLRLKSSILDRCCWNTGVAWGGPFHLLLQYSTVCSICVSQKIVQVVLFQIDQFFHQLSWNMTTHFLGIYLNKKCLVLERLVLSITLFLLTNSVCMLLCISNSLALIWTYFAMFRNQHFCLIVTVVNRQNQSDKEQPVTVLFIERQYWITDHGNLR